MNKTEQERTFPAVCASHCFSENKKHPSCALIWSQEVKRPELWFQLSARQSSLLCFPGSETLWITCLHSRAISAGRVILLSKRYPEEFPGQQRKHRFSWSSKTFTHPRHCSPWLCFSIPFNCKRIFLFFWSNCCLRGSSPQSANRGLVLDASSLWQSYFLSLWDLFLNKLTLSRSRWPVSAQLFQLKCLSKLTYSIWLLS